MATLPRFSFEAAGYQVAAQVETQRSEYQETQQRGDNELAK